MATGRMTSSPKITEGDAMSPLHDAAQEGQSFVNPLLDREVEVKDISDDGVEEKALCKHCCVFASTIAPTLVSNERPWPVEHQPNWTALTKSALVCASCAMIKTVLQPYIGMDAHYPEHDQPIDLTLMRECDVDVRVRGHQTPAHLLYLYPPHGTDRHSCIRI